MQAGAVDDRLADVLTKTKALRLKTHSVMWKLRHW